MNCSIEYFDILAPTGYTLIDMEELIRRRLDQ